MCQKFNILIIKFIHKIKTVRNRTFVRLRTVLIHKLLIKPLKRLFDIAFKFFNQQFWTEFHKTQFPV